MIERLRRRPSDSGVDRSGEAAAPARTSGERAPRVEILLSTYNGHRYLREQVDSILDQTWPNFHLTIRDDGSQDGTLALLDQYARHARVRVCAEGYLGLPDSFFALVDTATPEAEFVAFSDQDDVWLPSKIERAVRALEAEEVTSGQPALYCSRVVITDARLNSRGTTPLPRRGPSFGNALVENIATGCTIVLNRSARALFQSSRWPQHALAHDWWTYQVVAAFGRVICDPEPLVLYRQHGQNKTGIGATRTTRLLRKVQHQFRGGSPGRLLAQAQELKRLYGARLPTPHRATLERFLAVRHWTGRLTMACLGGVHRQSLVDDLALRVLLVCGRV